MTEILLKKTLTAGHDDNRPSGIISNSSDSDQTDRYPQCFRLTEGNRDIEIIFRFLYKNIYCDPSLEPSLRDGCNEGSQYIRDGCNEGSQYIFLLRNKIKFSQSYMCYPFLSKALSQY